MAETSKVTLKQVATAAGVSIASASMILRGREDVSFAEETVTRVRHAAESLGYRVKKQPVVSSFVRPTILIFLPAVTGNFYTSMAQAITQAANRDGYDTVCFETHRDRERELRGLSYAENAAFIGIIFTYYPRNHAQVERMAQERSIVVVGNTADELDVDMIQTDHRRAGEMMARHMLSLGHTNVAVPVVSRAWQGYSNIERLNGILDFYKHECPEANVYVKSVPSPDTLRPGSLFETRQLGKKMCEECLDDNQHPITGFLCITDFIAYGVLDALAERHLSVPKDYSVCSCDDIFASSLPGVSLTSVDRHTIETGFYAFDLLKRRISLQTTPEIKHSIMRVGFLCTLTERNSTGKAREIATNP